MPSPSLKGGPEVSPMVTITALVVIVTTVVGLHLFGLKPHGKEPMPPAGQREDLKAGEMSALPGAKPFVPGARIPASESAAPPGLGPPPSLMSGSGQGSPDVSGPTPPGR